MKLFVSLFALVAVTAAQVSNEYLPPNYSGSSSGSYEVSAAAPVAEYLAPAASYESYDVGASAPAHSYSEAEGYRYKTQRRRVFKTARRHRREVSSEYLPPVASYSAPAASYSVAASAPEVAYSAPAVSYETYDVAASAPAHSYSDDDGYRYKTQRRRVFKTARRHRREVSSEYLPPVASYSAPAASYSVAASAPEVAYSAPAASYETYDVAASAPAHSYSDDDGYRYKTQRRRVFKTARRHRREVSSEYLPPVASYSAPAASYSVAASAPEVAYSAPAASYETYDVAASAPAHSYSDDDGYRYKTQRRRVFKTARRHRREVSSEYLPPVASYSAPAASYSVAASAPEVAYSAPAPSYETYDVSASAPAHSFSESEGYRYRTSKRRVIRRRRF